jgi:hypothetical protein
MAANTAGIYGAQIFRQDDKPKYRRGFSINLAVLSVGLSLAILRFFDELIHKRRARRQGLESPGGEQLSNNEDEFDKAAIARPAEDQPQPIIVGSEKR